MRHRGSPGLSVKAKTVPIVILKSHCSIMRNFGLLSPESTQYFYWPPLAKKNKSEMMEELHCVTSPLSTALQHAACRE